MPNSDITAAQIAALGSAGRHLYDELTATFDFEVHELVLLLEAARVTDRLEALNAELASGVTRKTRSGTQVKPASVEARQLELTLARLIASLRLPATKTAARPQRRGSLRGVYAPKAV